MKAKQVQAAIGNPRLHRLPFDVRLQTGPAPPVHPPARAPALRFPQASLRSSFPPPRRLYSGTCVRNGSTGMDSRAPGTDDPAWMKGVDRHRLPFAGANHVRKRILERCRYAAPRFGNPRPHVRIRRFQHFGVFRCSQIVVALRMRTQPRPLAGSTATLRCYAGHARGEQLPELRTRPAVVR